MLQDCVLSTGRLYSQPFLVTGIHLCRKHVSFVQHQVPCTCCRAYADRGDFSINDGYGPEDKRRVADWFMTQNGGSFVKHM